MKDIWIRGNIPMLGAHAQVKEGRSLHLQFPAMLRVSLGYNLFLERIFVTFYGFGWRVYLGSFFAFAVMTVVFGACCFCILRFFCRRAR